MRGLFDGLREGMSKEMTPKKFKLTLDGMSAICIKLFDHVPIQEAWTANQITTAMRRQAGTSPDLKTVTGCLNSLKEAGLVKETERGLFRQVVPRETPAPIGEHIASLPKVPITASPSFTGTLTTTAIAERPEPLWTPALAREASPAQTFGVIADGLRIQAAGLLKKADEMDAAALAFEQQIEDANKRLERFNQLKALLAS
jgi:hypothetical protein